METATEAARRRVPWNKDKLVGQKAPLKLQQIYALRIRLQLAGRRRDLALFNLAIDSKLRACDLVRILSAKSGQPKPTGKVTRVRARRLRSG